MPPGESPNSSTPLVPDLGLDAKGDDPVGSLALFMGRDELTKVVLQKRYRLERLIAQGSTGAVYAARDERENTKVAVKVLSWWQDDSKALQRFRQEAALVAALNHPNIVMRRDFGRTPEGVYFIVMELLEGASLASRLERGQRFDDIRMVERILGGCCAALAALHEAGVVHRDLKPSNVFLAGPAQSCIAKILDFGLSKLLDSDSHLTQRGDVLGSLGYMSPEQALGRACEADGSADIYALGAISYRMLTGRAPFIADNLAELTEMVLSQTPAPPSTLCALPGAIERLLMDALAKEASQRPSSAGEFFQRFQRALAGP